ncbi:MAG: hypothetical protein COV10_01260 [Candidatus Vogelbacteria bacterium CG10_big_fil_rev_8_21_14_0_10_51_16]|uniref:DUF2238 domain-containing protein n=1 Tax=Candidatus Vogelbacteria bacterium CG10_big_fil_rev_8_21_14_0_10_51_16 TaxID=1975045 RepID=A0A2H0RGJ1_9BACT|nr:MAG: hypothetical protein COV10_01260 [Candidatus Vogelbacteria bacterium CG10_big_fil_rev_8_21_14_0_10_51_16]
MHKLSPFLEKPWLPILAGFLLFGASAVGGVGFELHITTIWFDKLLHFLGGMVVTWFVLTAIPHLRTTLAILAVVLVVGLLWEMAEWWGSFGNTSAFPLYAKYMGIGTHLDTIFDLLFDLLGGAVLLARVKLKTLFTLAREKLQY